MMIDDDLYIMNITMAFLQFEIDQAKSQNSFFNFDTLSCLFSPEVVTEYSRDIDNNREFIEIF